MDNQTLRNTIAEAIHQGDRKMPREYYQIAGDVMFALKYHGYRITKEPTEGGREIEIENFGGSFNVDGIRALKLEPGIYRFREITKPEEHGTDPVQEGAK